jgi:hypothetical protein
MVPDLIPNRFVRNLFGNIDTWLVWNLTGGPQGGFHITAVTNASRAMLMNLESMDWDPEIMRIMGVPREMLPEIHSPSEVYGNIESGELEAAAILIGVGVDELSLNPVGIPQLKTVLRQFALPQAVALAEKALAENQAADVRRLAKNFMETIRLQEEP